MGTETAPGWGTGVSEGRSHNRMRMCWYPGQKWEWLERQGLGKSRGEQLTCHLQITAVEADKVLLVKEQW